MVSTKTIKHQRNGCRSLILCVSERLFSKASYLRLFGKYHQLSAKTSRYKEEKQPCIRLCKLLTADDGGEQPTYRTLFRHQERLSAKKRVQEELRGLTI